MTRRGQAIVYETLDAMGIQYEELEHDAVFTGDEMARLPFPPDVIIAKNLFLRDAKGKRHFLVVQDLNKTADLRGLEERLGATRLSFASEERLARHLGLTKGSVTPFGVLNDAARAVEVFFDAGLGDFPRVGVHPNLNTATLLLPFADIVRVVREHGNPVTVLS